ncbi:MAG: T9SS type A sorting domain-containing protein [Ignavibacteriales bacterium]|nr:T9SS type A sorting domain-containing protein [Ignavibacteriales bacterium]
MKKLLILFVFLILSIPFLSITYSQWSPDPLVNNPVCVGAWGKDNGYPPCICSDGSGGVIIVWFDERNTSTTGRDIYAQRIDASGVVKWALNGIAVCTATGVQTQAAVVSDGSGGAIVTWVDFRRGSYTDIYAQRIDANGIIKWTAGGNIVFVGDIGSHWSPVITTDGNHGAIITWYDSRDESSTNNIYAQRIDGAGVPQWLTLGVNVGIQICGASRDQIYPKITSDGYGGAIICWEDYRSGTKHDVYAQRINSTGSTLWTTDGVAVCNDADGFNERHPQLISDGSGGAFFTWENSSYVSYVSVSATHFDGSGAVVTGWPKGISVSMIQDLCLPKIASDGSGGVFVTWFQGESNNDIYAQRINGSGTFPSGWSTGGNVVCNALVHQNNPEIISDGIGGAIISWLDQRGSDQDIYAQRMDAGGSVHSGWTSNGKLICGAIRSQSDQVLISNGSEGAIICWNDYRNIATYDIYATNLKSDGSLLPVELTSFTANLIGKEVKLSWKTATEVNNYGFNVERRMKSEEWSTLGFINGNGNSNSPKEYSYIDRTVSSGNYIYRLKQIDNDGKYKYSSQVEVTGNNFPNGFILEQNYPNPFNPTTNIEYNLSETGIVKIGIFNILGEQVTLLKEQIEEPGHYNIEWNAQNYPSGIYFCKLEFNSKAGSKLKILKMILSK